MSYLQEAASDVTKKYIYLHFPHGVMPMSEVVSSTLRPVMWPGAKIFALGANSIFRVPFWRHFYAWMGSVPATADNFKKLLARGSVVVIVGGVAGGWVDRWVRERERATQGGA